MLNLVQRHKFPMEQRENGINYLPQPVQNSSNCLSSAKMFNKDEEKGNNVCYQPQPGLDGIEPTLPTNWFGGQPQNCSSRNEVMNATAPIIRPWSAYALFFREVQSEIRTKQNNGKSAMNFGELSKTIAKRWQKMGRKEKMMYRERLKELRRMQLRSKASRRAFELLGRKMDNAEKGTE